MAACVAKQHIHSLANPTLVPATATPATAAPELHPGSSCRECIALLKELDAPAKHILLTTHAYEHKIFIAPFQRRFKDAQVYVVPK